MKDIADLTREEIDALLSPLIDLSLCENCSLSGLAKKTGEVLDKMRKSGGPLKLALRGGILALVCDARAFVELEQRRRKLVDLLAGVETQQHARLGRVGKTPASITGSTIRQLVECQKQIDGIKHSQILVKGNLYGLSQQLEELEAQKNRLVTGLQTGEPVRR